MTTKKICDNCDGMGYMNRMVDENNNAITCCVCGGKGEIKKMTIEELAKSKGMEVSIYPFGDDANKWIAEARTSGQYVSELISFTICAIGENKIKSRVRDILEAI